MLYLNHCTIVNHLNFLIGAVFMSYSYNKLWKLLIDKDMKKKDLKDAANISSSTITKMSKGLPVNLEVLSRVCNILEVDIGDVLELLDRKAL